MTEQNKERLVYAWWHQKNLCKQCNGCGMTGPLDDPDCCLVCDGFGHLQGFDYFKDEAFKAYDEAKSRGEVQ